VPILKPEPDLSPPDLFERNPPAAHWWVAHARSRQEKAIARHLRERRVPYYLPLRAKEVRRRGRRTISYLPLFTGYVFFGGGLEERRLALQSHVLASVLAVDDQALLEAELRNLWRVQCSGAPLVPHPYLGPGAEVEIVAGPLRGARGKVLREKGKLRLVVSITLLRQSVAAELERDILAPARTRGRS
jgi:transcription antitermination factor NusG